MPAYTDVKPTNMRERCFAVPGDRVFQCETIDYSKCKPPSTFGPFVVGISMVSRSNTVTLG